MNTRRRLSDLQQGRFCSTRAGHARQMGVDCRFRFKDLPSNAELREQIGALANIYEGARRERLEALRMMRRLDAFSATPNRVAGSGG